MVTVHRALLGRPAIHAITFSPHGGGIAAVSRLVRQALTEASVGPVPCHLLATSDRYFMSSIGDRVRFGLQSAATQVFDRCDWVFYTHLNLASVQRFVPAAVARPYAVFLHDVEAWTPLTSAMRQVLAGAFLRVANSRYTAARVEQSNPGCGPVAACPLALPPGAEAESTVDAASTDPLTVLIVGRMTTTDRYKGHDELIDVWPQVIARVPCARLVCVGEGDDVPRLRSKAAAAGVASAVEFTGFVDDATRTRAYATAAVMAMPSRREGFGLVYVEAMAAGVPCIGSIHDAASEVIVDGETGCLVDQDNREELVSALVRLLEDPALRRRLGAAGRARYLAHFTYDTFRDRLCSQLAAALPPETVRLRKGRPPGGTA